MPTKTRKKKQIRVSGALAPRVVVDDDGRTRTWETLDVKEETTLKKRAKKRIT